MNTALASALATALLGLTPTCPAVDRPGDPPGSPAAFFPSHTYLYLQVNPFQTVQGFKSLQLARLLQDPTLNALFGQLLQSIPPQSDPRRMLQRYPFDRAIGDRIGLGTIGFVAKVQQEQGPAEVLRFPEDGAVSPRLFRGRVNFQGANLLVIRVEDEELFRKTLMQLLTDLVFRGKPPEVAAESVDGVALQVLPMPGVGKLYSAVAAGYFLLGQSAEDVVAAVRRQAAGAASLATRSDIRRFAKHRGATDTAGFVHLGIDSALATFGTMIPSKDRAEIERWGGFDFAGLQAGMGFCDGGICEWLHLAFAENPRGLFLNLARLWPDAGYTKVHTRRGTVYAASLTFDWAAFYGATTTLLELCGVDCSRFAAQARGALGMDLRDDLMAALGNNIGVVALLPDIGFIPELSFTFKIRNRAKMEAVLGKLEGACQAAGLPLRKFTVSGDGPRATYVTLGKDLPIKPAFVIRGDQLVVSTMPLTLKYAVREDRDTGRRVVDHVPDASRIDAAAGLAWFYDPAPLTRNTYADLLKLLDSSGQRLPVDVTDLPSPEFVAAALSKIGFRVTVDPYFMALELHSPTGFAIPMVVGGVIAAQQQQRSRSQARSGIGQ